MISKINKEHILNLLKNKKRIDGRKLDEYREIIVEQGVSKNADGSARVKIGNTEVMAGVKFNLSTPYSDSPNEGVLSVGAEFLPIASPDFEAGPPSEGAVELARVVDRGIRESKTIDFKKLCIEKVWMLFLDIIIINHDGNLIDAAGIAGIAALLDTKMPKLNKDETINREEYAGKLSINEIPIPVTVRKANNTHVLDTNVEEEGALLGRITMGIKNNGNICSIQKGEYETFDIEEIVKIGEICQKKAKEIRSKHFKK
jgi:exosome complex component RRP42